MSRRETDSRGEKAMGVFLDKYFYPQALQMRALSYAERIYDKDEQIKGIDIIAGKSKIDEKAQLYYINRPVNSFAFEIDYYNETVGAIVDGWFVSTSNETEQYLLLWIPKAKTNQINRLVSEDFEVVSADLISKNRIKRYLEREGITDDLLKANAVKMRENNEERLVLCEGVTMIFSTKGYTEKPINIVIKKPILDELSSKVFEIRKSGVKLVK